MERVIDRFLSQTPFVAGSSTSDAAAEYMRGKRAAKGREQVLSLLRQHPEGLTDEEGTEMLNMNPSTYRPRRVELHIGGFIEKAGLRNTHSGRLAQVWRVPQGGWRKCGE